jgi:hypothetical protein
MTVVTELELPEIDYNMPGFGPDTYHQLLGAARQRNWLAHSPLAYIVLDAESGDFFLRARQTTFPGRQIAELFGITSGPLHDNVENNILNLTGDKHRRLRSLIGHAFTPKAADRWRPAMRGFLARLWADLGPEAGAGTEFVAAIAKPWPTSSTAASCSPRARSSRSAPSGPTGKPRAARPSTSPPSATASSSPSAPAPTTASASTWPGPSSRRPSPSSPRGCPAWNWRASRPSAGSRASTTSTRSRCAGPDVPLDRRVPATRPTGR